MSNRKKEIRDMILLLLIIFLFIVYIEMSHSNLYNKEDRNGRVYWHGPKDKSNIALTFDDGPSKCTSEILDILKKHRINATFFIIGKNAEEFPDMIKREISEGYAIGGHSYSHPDMQIEIPAQIKEQLEKTERIVKNISGLNLNLFRPPYGFDNRFVLKETVKRGYIAIEWSASGRDWEKNANGKSVSDEIIKNAKNGTIILLHDGRSLNKNPDCSSTIDSLPVIIENLTSQGYNFVTIPELLGINNTYNNLV